MRRASASPMPLEAPVTSATSCAMESPPRGRWVVPLSTEHRALTASGRLAMTGASMALLRSEEHTSELQSPCNLVCRLLLEKKKKKIKDNVPATQSSLNCVT